MAKHLPSFRGVLFYELHTENSKKILIGMFSLIHGLYECMRRVVLPMIRKLDPGLTSLVPALGEFARNPEFFGHDPCDAAHESDDCPF